MKIIKRLSLFLLASSLIGSIFTTNVFAKHDENKHAQDTTYYFGVDKEETYTEKQKYLKQKKCKKRENGKCKEWEKVYGTKDVTKTRKVFESKLDDIIKDNDWAYLKKTSCSGKDVEVTIDDNFDAINVEKPFNFYLPIPAYLDSPDNTALKDYPLRKLNDLTTLSWYNFGINPYWTGFDWGIQSATLNKDGKSLDHKINNSTGPETYTWEIMKRWYIPDEYTDSSGTNVLANPYKFTSEDVLSEENVKDALNLRFKADLKRKENSDSKKVDELKVGDNINLDCKLNADWFNKLVCSEIMGYYRNGMASGNQVGWKKDFYYKNDSEIVFALYLPKGVEVDKDVKAKLSGLDGFVVEVKKEEDIMKDSSNFINSINAKNDEKRNVLVVKIKPEENKSANVIELDKLIKRFKGNSESKIDLSNIVVSIKGLKVSKNVPTDENVTIKASVGAYYDLAFSQTNEFSTNITGDAPQVDRLYWTFAAVQDPDGLDEAAPKDKPNQISYTFKVAQAPKPEPIPEEPVIVFKPHEYVETHPVNAIIRDEILEELIHEKYIFGYPEDIIKPDGNMTRAEAVSVVARLEKLKLEDEKEIFKDTKAGAWYNKALNAAYKAGYLEEKEGDNFRPNEQITRAELAQLISHIDKKNEKIAPFEDIKGHKYEKAINMAYGNGRIKGYPDGSFKPDKEITRAEVASMLNKLYNRYPDKNFIDANPNKIHSYKDLEKTHWAYYELVEAYETHKYHRLANNMEEWIDIIK